ncbi:MAG TPA: hypothetical protein VFF04_04690 [Candidatus Babeliales bacterium]|nr:hypothetical protein [Candidatus Babeliales bacterium]
MRVKLSLYIVLIISSLSIQAQDNQDLIIDDTLQCLCEPITTSATGLATFLRQVYNQPLYAQEVLPNFFSHIVQFLEHGKKTKQSKAYTQSVVRLFANKLKGCQYVNAHAFGNLLGQLPALLEGHFLVQRSTDMHLLQDKINKLLYEQFKTKFSTFQSNPTAFFNELTQDICQTLSQQHQDLGEITVEELRKSILIFIEVGLNKLIWSPEDQLDTWRAVKSISEQLAALMECNIIADPDDLNGLFVSLLERYCLFIDIAGDDLSNSFYEEVKSDIASTSLLLLELEEQEQLIESKRERLLQAIDHAHQKHKQAAHA